MINKFMVKSLERQGIRTYYVNCEHNSRNVNKFQSKYYHGKNGGIILQIQRFKIRRSCSSP